MTLGINSNNFLVGIPAPVPNLIIPSITPVQVIILSRYEE
jgi:hypothetical protein